MEIEKDTQDNTSPSLPPSQVRHADPSTPESKQGTAEALSVASGWAPWGLGSGGLDSDIPVEFLPMKFSNDGGRIIARVRNEKMREELLQYLKEFKVRYDETVSREYQAKLSLQETAAPV
jgi:hypothetical protein